MKLATDFICIVRGVYGSDFFGQACPIDVVRLQGPLRRQIAPGQFVLTGQQLLDARRKMPQTPSRNI